MTILLAVTRWAHLLALMALFGAAAFGWLLQRRALFAPPASHLWLAAAILAVISAAVQLVLATANMSGAVDRAALADVLKFTLFGEVFLIRIAALGVLTVLSIDRKPNLLQIAALSGIALAAVAATSHAAASGREEYALLRGANDALHLLTGGFWIGGLVVLFHLARSRAATLHASVSLFSEAAIYVVSLLALAGMINAGFIYAAQRVSWTYTALLLLKVPLAGAMVVIAFINRLRLTPALETNGDAAPFTRNLRTEIALGAGVVALAAILGSISPG